MLEKYPKEVKLVTKHFPLPNHSGARPGSEASLAAARQGKYWEFHEEIFKDFRDLNDDKLVAIAKNLGLDIEKFNKDRKDPAIQALIDGDVNEGRQAGVRGTPTIFVNGIRLQNRSLEGFQEVIEKALKSK